MTYSVGNSTPANYANTSSGKVTNVVADNGVGGSGEVVNVVDRVPLSVVIDTNVQYPTINVSAITGYIAGKSDLVITVNSGVYVYGYTFTPYQGFDPNPNPFSATMNILGGTTGDTIKLVNNGYILGAGGDGAGATGYQILCCCCTASLTWTTSNATPGGAALLITYPLTLENNGFIAGGGGGGELALADNNLNWSIVGGGGGAGGGISVDTVSTVTARIIPPNIGNNGNLDTIYYSGGTYSSFYSGGGGGFKLTSPDNVGGIPNGGVATYSTVGAGGGTGGSGAAYSPFSGPYTYTNNGGNANSPAPEGYFRGYLIITGGGGGGWGASGARGSLNGYSYGVGAVGGNSIITNGNAITTITAGTQYGTINSTNRTYVRTLSSSASTTYVTIPAGYSNAILIVPTGVTLRANSISNPALNISGTIANVKIIVNGAILGKGGDGGSEAGIPTGGGDAIRVDNFAVEQLTVDCTYGYVAGGGGGGGNADWSSRNVNAYGGGGAGGGNSGNGSSANIALGATTAGTSGSNGSALDACGTTYITGGGGGLIVPGTSVSLGVKNTAITPFPGIGGSGGGSGAAYKSSSATTTFINNGGGFNQIGGTQTGNISIQAASGGGGGGWGAIGGNGRRITAVTQSGATAGYAVSTGVGSPVYIINPANVAGYIY